MTEPPAAAAAATAAAGSAKKGGKAPPAPPREWTAELEADYQRILRVGEECISDKELKALLIAKGRGIEDPSNRHINLYDGFEPSGRMHIAQGVFKAMNVNKCTAEGTNATFVFWVADWFALMNDKMGGDLDKIKTVGHYLIEVWKAAGMQLDHVVFKWASAEITEQAHIYWPQMLDVARRFNITRIKKCCQIMGRLEGSLTAAQILYPLMQCTDVFFLKADICQLGVDQRKVNMLAREYCEAAKIKNKPIILSHHMLFGLKAGQEKMSKSDPDSAIFMEDSPEDVERKILNAYCPDQEEEEEEKVNNEEAAKDEDNVVEVDAGKESMHLVKDTLKNPCLDYIQHIIFSPPGATFTAEGATYTEFATVKTQFLAGKLSADGLKRGLIDSLNALLEPVRTHFATNETAKTLLATMQQYKKEASSSSSTTSSTVRRLNLVELNKVPAQSHVVFAPLPNAAPTLQEAMDLLALLSSSSTNNNNNNNGTPRILFLSDWSARVCNACGADVKGIAAYYQVLTTALTAMDPQLMSTVQILFQSEAILADPSNYWISVINVGRHFPLNTVMGEGLSSTPMQDSDGAGQVIARLMRVADVAGLEPATLSLLETDPSSVVHQSMMETFFEAKLPGVKCPTVTMGQGPILALQPPRESQAHVTEHDEYYLLDDPKVSYICVYL
jgi:tyrosyl-tRNA synthetase